MKTESKKDHDKDKDNPNLPVGEAPGADLVSRPEKSEQGGSAPGAELAPRANAGPKAPTTMDAAKRDDRSASEPKARARAATDPVAPGCVRCRVTGSAIKYNGKFIEEGKVADFDKATQKEMAHILVPLEDDGSNCPACTLEDGRVVKPCLEHYVKAGYPADTYERRFGSSEE